MAVEEISSIAGPLLAAVLAGGTIGLEREWRGRAAGLRTHILVCLASAALMELSASQGLWRLSPLPGAEIVSDPARMAHGVLTGIGFLCAGVIFRSGFSVHGLTTAASLWITAAIGLVFGTGLYALGAVVTGLTVIVLLALRLVSARLPRTSTVDVRVEWLREAAVAESETMALLAAFADPDPAEHHELVENGTRVRLSMRLTKMSRTEIADLARNLRALPGVVAYSLDPRDD